MTADNDNTQKSRKTALERQKFKSLFTYYVILALPLFWENQKINFAMRFSGYACSH